MICAQFISVGEGETDTLNLYNLKPNGEIYDIGDIYLYILNPNGMSEMTYAWNPHYENLDGTTGAWCNEGGGTKQPDRKFPVGTGLWFQGYSATFIQASGAVYMDSLDIPLRDGNTPCGNPYPIDIDLENIIATGDIYDLGDVYMYILNENGLTEKTYAWNPHMTWVDKKGNSRVGAWCNEGGGTRQEGTIPAGQGLWVQGYDNTFIVFDKPSL